MVNKTRKSKIRHNGKLKCAMHSIEAIQSAVDACGGKPADLAREAGVSWQQVKLWLTGRTIVTAERAVAIEEITKGKVTREEIRPDLFRIRERAAYEVGKR